MSADGRVYDGHTAIFGVDTDTDPSEIPANTAARAVNRIFRGGKNRTRPPFHHTKFDFSLLGDDECNCLLYGNFQGWFPYKKKKPGRKNGLVLAIGGSIFFAILVNDTFIVYRIFTGNDKKLFQTWFCQAEEWLYIQNGSQQPIFWDGLIPSTARRSIPEQNEMPIGTIMAYIHGRVFVSNAFDQIAASDIIYGNGFTTTTATQKFTENLYWNEGGYFGQPTDLGEIFGMAVAPRQDRNLTGQGELIILGTNGASAIEASVPRSQWKDSKIQTVTMMGRGCVASDSVILVNNDVFFRADDGLASYQDTMTSETTKLSFGKLSRQVNIWMRNDTEWLQRYASSVYFDNRIISTVSPEISLPSDLSFGNHRYNKGLVVLDLDQASGVTGDGNFNWDGLWTGIRTCGLTKLDKQGFAFSHDSDGVNRIYEINRLSGNDKIEDSVVQQEWSYVTKRFDWNESNRSNSFEVKKMLGGEVWLSEVPKRITIGAQYRPDNMPTWSEAMGEQEWGSNFEGEFTFSADRYGRLRFGTPASGCISGAPYPLPHGAQHQIRIYGTGNVRIDRMRISMIKNDSNSEAKECRIDNAKIQLDSELIDDYSYSIADNR